MLAWQHPWQPDDLIILLDHLLATSHIDPKRIYFKGLSMGGYETWTAIEKHEKRFAAAAPFAGEEIPFRPKALAMLTVYPGVGQDSRTLTYANPKLYQWFLKQQRP